MDFVRSSSQLKRPVVFLAATTALFLSAQTPALAGKCASAPDVVAHLDRSAHGTPGLHDTPSPQSFPGDILDHIDAIPDVTQRAPYRKLITALRSQTPPLRGIETYERVVFAAARSGGDVQAILDTRIPTATRGENVVEEMIRHLETHSTCHTWSVCGAEGARVFQEWVHSKIPNPLSSMRETLQKIRQLPANESVRSEMSSAQATLLARLRSASQSGEIRYEDLIRLSVEYARLNLLNFDVRQLLRPEFSEAQVDLDDWSRLIGPFSDPLQHSRSQQIIADMLSPDHLKQAVITFSARPYGVIEIAPPHVMLTAFELAPSPAIADEVPQNSLDNVAHDLDHRTTMIGDDSSETIIPPLHDLDFQLSRVRAWEPFHHLLTELRGTSPTLAATLEGEVFQTWHESGSLVDFAKIFRSLSNRTHGPHIANVHGLKRYIESNPRWALEVERAFSDALTHLLQTEGRQIGTSPNPVVFSRNINLFIQRYFPKITDQSGWVLVSNTNSILQYQQSWKAFNAYASNPARSPLERRLLQRFLSRIGERPTQ